MSVVKQRYFLLVLVQSRDIYGNCKLLLTNQTQIHLSLHAICLLLVSVEYKLQRNFKTVEGDQEKIRQREKVSEDMLSSLRGNMAYILRVHNLDLANSFIKKS